MSKICDKLNGSIKSTQASPASADRKFSKLISEFTLAKDTVFSPKGHIKIVMADLDVLCGNDHTDKNWAKLGAPVVAAVKKGLG